MRTTYRILSTAVAVGAMFPIGLPVAGAAEVKLPVEVGSWFWDDQRDDTSQGSVPRALSGVPAGDLAVAITDGAGRAPETEPGDPADPADDQDQKRSNKETFLQWDLSAYGEGSIVESFAVTMFLDPAGESVSVPALQPPGQPARGGQPNIIACRPLVGFGEADGDGYANKPGLDCRDASVGAFDATAQSYTFDLTVFAQDWVDGLIDNRGVGIRPELDEDDPFNLVFQGPAKIVTTAVIVPAEPEEPVAEDPPLLPAPDPGFDSGSGGSTVVFEPAPEVPAPAPAPAPVAPAPAAPKPQVQVSTVAARPVQRDLSVGPSFWLALLAGAGLLGVVSLILGDPVVPVRGRRAVVTRAPAATPLRARRTGVAVRPRSI